MWHKSFLGKCGEIQGKVSGRRWLKSRVIASQLQQCAFDQCATE